MTDRVQLRKTGLHHTFQRFPRSRMVSSRSPSCDSTQRSVASLTTRAWVGGRTASGDPAVGALAAPVAVLRCCCYRFDGTSGSISDHGCTQAAWRSSAAVWNAWR